MDSLLLLFLAPNRFWHPAGPVCQAGDRRLQPRQQSSITGLNLGQVPLQRRYKGKTIKSNIFKLSWSCIVLHVCFVFSKFVWVIFRRLFIIPLDEMWGSKVMLFLAGFGNCLIMLVCYFGTSHHAEWHKCISCNSRDNLREVTQNVLYSTVQYYYYKKLICHEASFLKWIL